MATAAVPSLTCAGGVATSQAARLSLPAESQSPGSEDIKRGELEAGGHLFSGDRLHLRRPIVLDGEEIGWIYLQYDLREFYGDLKQLGVILTATMIISLVGAFLISSRMQRVLTRPVTELAKTAQQVTEDKWRIGFEDPAGGEIYRLSIESSTSLELDRVSCGSDKLSPVTTYKLRSLNMEAI